MKHTPSQTELAASVRATMLYFKTDRGPPAPAAAPDADAETKSSHPFGVDGGAPDVERPRL
jgi:hypothetical protein